MGCVLLAHQSACEEGEAGLHEKHQVSCVECPPEIRADSDVADSVGELSSQRFLSGLGLVLIELLLELFVIRGALICWLGNDEWSPGRIYDVGSISGRHPCWIRLRFLVRQKGSWQSLQHPGD